MPGVPLGMTDTSFVTMAQIRNTGHFIIRRDFVSMVKTMRSEAK